jgi:hypothetical protein
MPLRLAKAMIYLMGCMVIGPQNLWADSSSLKPTSAPLVPVPREGSSKVGPASPVEANRQATIQWVILPGHSPGFPRLKIQLTKLLTPKQVNLLEGGFTTVSQLLISIPKKTREPSASLEALQTSPTPEEDEDPEDLDNAEVSGISVPIRQVSCSVKFDAWQESFEVIKIMDHPEKTSSEPVIVKDLDAFGELCLTADLEFEKTNKSLVQQGGVFLATMIVKQTSREETAKIKGWLIKQQSGVIQGLFSHMLGELTLQQKVHTELVIPPAPSSALPLTPGPLPPRTQESSGFRKAEVDQLAPDSPSQPKKPKIARKGGAIL